MADPIPLPDWKLPSGVSRGLWDYLHTPTIAQRYHDDLAGSTLLKLDLAFAEKWFDQPGRLIDLGCGTGRLLVPFARRGYWALGVDLAEEMLRVCGRMAAASGVTVERIQANLVELDCVSNHSFDYAACLFSTLGMVVGKRERFRVVEHAFRVLKPGGRFVLHVHNRWFNAWNPVGRRWLLRNSLAAIIGREAAGDHTMPVHQGIAGLVLHLFTRREAIRLLRSVGFQIREVLPISLREDGRVINSWWFGRLRAYGYLIAAQRPLS